MRVHTMSFAYFSQERRAAANAMLDDGNVLRAICDLATVDTAFGRRRRRFDDVARFARVCRSFATAMRVGALRYKQEYNDALPVVIADRLWRAIVSADASCVALDSALAHRDCRRSFLIKTNVAPSDGIVPFIYLFVSTWHADEKDARSRMFALLDDMHDDTGCRYDVDDASQYRRIYHFDAGSTLRHMLDDPRGRELMALMFENFGCDSDVVRIDDGERRTWREWLDSARAS